MLVGASGGMVPCPAALVILLLAISLGKIALGLILIGSFSLGLAAVLITIGIIMVKASRLLTERMKEEHLQKLPLVSAGLIVLVGLTVTAKSAAAIFGAH